MNHDQKKFVPRYNIPHGITDSVASGKTEKKNTHFKNVETSHALSKEYIEVETDVRCLHHR